MGADILNDKGSTAAGSQQRPALLLVDDDPIIVESMGFVLSDAFEVCAAQSRAEALSALRRGGQVPDVALVDLGLPPAPHSPEGGFALIAELIALNPRMKVLVLSGQNERANVAHALSLGAADFIPKPCEPQLLKARLQHQLMILDADLTVAPETMPKLVASKPSSRNVQSSPAAFSAQSTDQVP